MCGILLVAALLTNRLGALSELISDPVVEMRWDFTDCGQDGRFGPQQQDCTEAYQSTNLDGDVIVTTGIQTWSAPISGLYLITARGASGLRTAGREGGLAAVTSGEFRIEKGETLNILVGQRSDYNPEAGENRGPGGSGGTYVTRVRDEFILMVAGGGSSSAGDVTSTTASHHADASLDENGKNASMVDGRYGTGGVLGYGGFRGAVFDGQRSSSGGGAGFDGNGNSSHVEIDQLQDVEFPKSSIRFVSSQFSDRSAGTGGFFMFRVDTTVRENNGGFGGGGSGSADGGAGGGGGFSGGGGGSWGGWGGGGGSINNAERPFLTKLHKGRGSVSISLIGHACCGPVSVYVAASCIAGIIVATFIMLTAYKCVQSRKKNATDSSQPS